MNDFVVVIPARFASTRLPGKPLRTIAGLPMIQYVHQLAMKSRAQEVWIATDDARIEKAAAAFAANVCMTGPDHLSGTERIAEVCEQLAWPDDLVVVNLQGDEPLLPPSLIDQCAMLLEAEDADMATLVSVLDTAADMENPNVAKVIVDSNDNALYFSRAAIPYCRDEQPDEAIRTAALRHHGIYAYRRAVLRRLVASGPCAMELCEKLEQLRALWLGITIRVGRVSAQPGPGVDTEEDLAIVQSIIEKRGRTD